MKHRPTSRTPAQQVAKKLAQFFDAEGDDEITYPDIMLKHDVSYSTAVNSIRVLEQMGYEVQRVYGPRGFISFRAKRCIPA